jgi:hypothetical protein
MGDAVLRLCIPLVMMAAIGSLSGCTGRSKPGHITSSGTSAASTTVPAVSSQPASSTALPSFTSQQSELLSSELAAGTEAGLRAAVAVPSGQELDPQVTEQLRAAGPIVFDEETFSRLDGLSATVTGRFTHSPAGKPAVWLFTLTYTGGTWKIVSTEPVR